MVKTKREKDDDTLINNNKFLMTYAERRS